MDPAELLAKVKANLILEYDEDDSLLTGFIASAVAYAEGYQKKGDAYYQTNPMHPTTEQAVIMLASHFYESRDGSTAGFWGDNVEASKQVWRTINWLLALEREVVI